MCPFMIIKFSRHNLRPKVKITQWSKRSGKVKKKKKENRRIIFLLFYGNAENTHACML